MCSLPLLVSSRAYAIEVAYKHANFTQRFYRASSILRSFAQPTQRNSAAFIVLEAHWLHINVHKRGFIGNGSTYTILIDLLNELDKIDSGLEATK